ncbi:MAG TPA: class I SAM-dependent methyltransferase [Pyrinomonadaceae bacterium]|nr:class I SAM-dependent methyltransferase [Pyrinomonadaceae bacterium]
MLNKLLAPLGLTVNRRPEPDREFEARYKEQLAVVRSEAENTFVCEYPINDTGAHPRSYQDYECEFAAKHISDRVPREILDIGSYRHFILGMLSHYPVTTVDVRSREPISQNETVLTCDAKALPLPDDSFDAVVALCALEHFGLGRYGDELDLEADYKALNEIKRVLRPNGLFIVSTTVTDFRPSIAFNAHRIYMRSQIRKMLSPLIMVDERVFSMVEGCESESITKVPGAWDVYCGCWRKEQ